MFGPNTYIDFPTSITHSHRDKEFMDTYQDLRELFVDVYLTYKIMIYCS